MKIFLFILFILFLNQIKVASQSCLSEGIVFSKQIDIDNFQTNYPGCNEIEGDVTIEAIGGFDIKNLNGLSGLTSVEGNMYIQYNHELTNLKGLDSLTFIGGDLWIYNNYDLISLSGLDFLTFIEGDFWIVNNIKLTNLLGLDSLTTIGNNFFIFSNFALESLIGLNTLSNIIGTLEIHGNKKLSSLLGLDFLSSIGGDFKIDGNQALSSITGPVTLTYIGGDFIINQNDILSSITDLDVLTSIGGNLSIGANFLLTNISGLETLTSIAGDLYIGYNINLTSLSGLENIDYSSISNLRILGNNSLSICEVKSICDYISNPNGTVTIIDNATGCNTQDEIISACMTSLSMQHINITDEFSIFPNPEKNILTFLIKNDTAIEEIIIYNQIGQKIQYEKPINNTINISELQQGVYIIEIISEQWKIRKKMIIE